MELMRLVCWSHPPEWFHPVRSHTAQTSRMGQHIKKALSSRFDGQFQPERHQFLNSIQVLTFWL